jgi:hypothetical protein
MLRCDHSKRFTVAQNIDPEMTPSANINAAFRP